MIPDVPTLIKSIRESADDYCSEMQDSILETQDKLHEIANLLESGNYDGAANEAFWHTDDTAGKLIPDEVWMFLRKFL